MHLEVERIDTPIGGVEVVAAAGRLVAIDFANCRDRLGLLLARRFGDVELRAGSAPGRSGRRISDYFDGDLGALDALAVDPGGTAFQGAVWKALRSVPAGRTATYGEIASAIGRPGCARAVGAANALNPVALAIPCHRIVGADGSLTGYAGGLSRKRWLLAHEGVAVD